MRSTDHLHKKMLRQEPYTIYYKRGGPIAAVVLAPSLNAAKEYGRCYYLSGIVERGDRRKVVCDAE